MVNLPIYPAAAYWSTRNEAVAPLSVLGYWRAVDRVPQTSLQEIRDAENNPMLRSILIDRHRRLNALRVRWLQGGY